jgi:O-methyltransferase involved in polyketide biosynthesis
MADASRDTSAPVGIDTSVSHSARIWNYWLGGTDNFEIDRVVGDQVREVLPEIVECALADRAFLGRVVRHLTADLGVRQYLDIGTGLPSADNTHEVAQRIAPDARIVYVDNDPLVLVHARALLAGSSEGTTDYIEGDLREPTAIIERAHRSLDFDRPIAVMLLGVLHYIGDDDEARAAVRRVLDAVPSGSYLAVQHPTNAVTGERMEEAVRRWNDAGGARIYLRTPEQLARFFDGMDLLEPGVVSCSRWRYDEGNEVDVFGAVGRKP